jgi:multicomponent Na+:H+ antiporter subunit G
MTGVVDVLALGCLLAGAFLCLTAGLGLVRFPDVLSRMHAGTKPQVLGVLLIMVGAAIRLHGWSATWMLLLVAVFQMLTAPVSAHMISRVAYRRRHVRRDLLLVDELRTTGADGRTAGTQDSVYRGDEPADAPPARPGEALARSRREDEDEDGDGDGPG